MCTNCFGLIKKSITAYDVVIYNNIPTKSITAFASTEYKVMHAYIIIYYYNSVKPVNNL